jgi:hypothetical protein
MSANVGWQRFLYLYIYAFIIISIGLLWTYGISLFSLHPVFAVFAWVISTGGTLSYRLWQKDSVPHARRRHRYMQQLACLSYAISLAGIVLSRWAGGKNLLSWSWHSIAGYLSMAAIGSQILVRDIDTILHTSGHTFSRSGASNLKPSITAKGVSYGTALQATWRNTSPHSRWFWECSM